jgi:hypothetical protein
VAGGVDAVGVADGPGVVRAARGDAEQALVLADDVRRRGLLPLRAVPANICEPASSPAPGNWPTAQASVAVRAETALRVVADGLTLGTTVQVGVAAMAVPASRASEAPAASAAGMSRCRMLVPSWLRKRLGPAPDRRKQGCNGADAALKRTGSPWNNTFPGLGKGASEAAAMPRRDPGRPRLASILVPPIRALEATVDHAQVRGERETNC